jgi:hypothetical protein
MRQWLETKENNMSVETKLVNLKNTAEGDLRALVVKLESIYQHVINSHVEDVVKAAVTADVHDAATKAEAIADTLRSDVSTLDVAATTVADKTAKK